jgi:spore coat protein U-like protein
LPLAFGNYSSAQLDATTTLTASCTVGTPYTVGLDAGLGTGATTTTRKMTSHGVDVEL